MSGANPCPFMPSGTVIALLLDWVRTAPSVVAVVVQVEVWRDRTGAPLDEIAAEDVGANVAFGAVALALFRRREIGVVRRRQQRVVVHDALAGIVPDRVTITTRGDGPDIVGCRRVGEQRQRVAVGRQQVADVRTSGNTPIPV